MKKLSIARRYAKALLLIGKEDGQAETYREELDGVAGIMAEHSDLESVIDNPLYEADGRRRVLAGIVEKLGVSKVMSSFLLLLFDKGRFGFLEDIRDFYAQMADEARGIARASLVSATELSSEAVEKIRKALSKRTGKEVVLDISRDPGLIGGIVTRIGDLVLDGSVKTQLMNMRESLKKS